MDVIGEFATRIRNAVSARHEKLDVPSSNMRVAIAEVLKQEGFIKNFKVVKDGRQGMMRIYLKFGDRGDSAIQKLQRMSRPGRRYYVHGDKIPKVRSGYGITILTTNRGVMSGTEAEKQGLGGEVLLKVW